MTIPTWSDIRNFAGRYTALIVTIAAGFYLIGFQSELLNVLAIAAVFVSFTIVSGNIAVYAYTRFNFDATNQTALGFIYLGTAIVVAGVLVGGYFVQFR
jgi:ABC-type maltose transport system permease subunit